MGSGATGALGPGSPLSTNGGDQVTLNAGGIAAVSGQDTIQFVTSDDLLSNKGSIVGADAIPFVVSLGGGTPAAPSYSAISFVNASGFSTETITNNSIIRGGGGGGAPGFQGANGDNGSWALVMTGSSLSNITITNTGSISGGDGGLSGLFGSGGNGADSIHLSATSSIASLAIVSTGTISGGVGNALGNAGIGGAGISLSAASMNDITVTTSGTLGAGAGGGGSQGGNGGNGIGLSGSAADSVAFSNNGIITAGGGGGYTGFNEIGNYGSGGDGIGLSESSMTDLSIVNNGSMHGGDLAGFGGATAGNGINLEVGSLSNITATNNGAMRGGFGGGNGLLFNGSVLDTGTITNTGTMAGGVAGFGIELGAAQEINNLSIFNGGAATGGDGTSYDIFASGGPGQHGISLSGSLVSTIVVSNTGTITGGNGGDGIYQYGGSGGTGLNISGSSVVNISVSNGSFVSGGAGATGDYVSGNGGNGMQFYGSAGLENLRIDNSGVIVGGSGGDGNGSGGDGIYFGTDPTGSIATATINNSSRIAGGDGSGQGGNGGDAVYLDPGNSSDLTLNNYGTIAGGNPAPGGIPGIAIRGSQNGLSVNNWGAICGGSGTNSVALSFSGNNNTLNLLGQSNVRGLVQSTGTNNVLNFSPSGLDGTSLAALQSALAPYLNGQPSTGSAPLLGGTCSWDSFIVESSSSSITSLVGFQGSYSGLAEAGGIDAGLFTLSLGSNGLFTGRLRLAAASYAFTGTFSSTGTCSFTARAGKTTIQGGLGIAANPVDKQIGGVITVATPSGEISYAVKAALLGTFTVQNLPAGLAGRYTVVIPPVSGTGPATPNSPGYATMTIRSSGALEMLGKLGDGRVFSTSAPLHADGKTWTLFQPLYIGKYPGSIAGTLTFEISGNSDCDGPVNWVKPELAGGHYYPKGFSITSDVLAAKYTAPPTLPSSGDITFSGADLANSTVTDNFTISSKGRITVSGTNRISLILSPGAGTFTGHFMDPGTNKLTPIDGVIYERPSPAAGYGQFLGSDGCGELEISQ